MNRLVTILLVSLPFVGCGRNPQPTQVGVEMTSPTPTPFVVPESLIQGEAEVTPIPISSPTSTPLPMFKSEAANEAVRQYVDTYNQLRALPAPNVVGVDVSRDHSAIIGNANALGNLTKQLADQQKILNEQLNPEEKRRFKAFVRSLNGQDEEQ